MITGSAERSAPSESLAGQQTLSTSLPLKKTGARLVSLDAYRGAIMLLMASSGFGLAQVVRHFPEDGFWAFLARHAEHAPWVGCRFWDLIQPAFMFMVGIALPWSVANRRAAGQSFSSMLSHALWRSLVLILLAVFLTSAWSKQTTWVFTNVLAQIGLGYPFLFLLSFTRPRTQWISALVILAAYWLVFAWFPLPPANFDWKSVGLAADWPHLTGFAAHWEKNVNFATWVDRWLLNWFPQEQPFVFSAGGYHTLNFVPSLATMIFGLLAGQMLRNEGLIAFKLKRLLLAGVAGILLGQVIAWMGLCPIVKRIWTPSWALYSAGWVTLFLALFVALIEGRGWRAWAFPMVVVGLNPITLYCMWQLMGSSVLQNLKTHLGPDVFTRLGGPYAPILERVAVLLVFWLFLLWMYRRKIFLRL